MRLTTAQQIQALDREAIETRHIPSVKLMERAAQGITEAALRMLPDKAERCRVTVFCGSGNNGGDGIAAARRLFQAGLKVRVFCAGQYEKLTPDALEMTGRLSECGIQLEPFDSDSADQRSWAMRSQVLIDALFGVGLNRAITPESRYAAAIRLLNQTPGKTISADIASGVECDTGRILGAAVNADKTITFTLPKIGQFVGAGGVLSGEVEVWDIGIPEDLLRRVVCPIQSVSASFVRESLPVRRPGGHKGNFGKLLIVGGSVGYTGAPQLAATAAVRSGCGLVYLGVPREIWPVEAQKCVSSMPFPLSDRRGLLSYRALPEILDRLSGCDVLALGPGLGRSEQLTQLVCDLLLSTEKAVVLDADGINALKGHIDILDARRGRVTILTPHDGEFARMGGDLKNRDRVSAAREFAQTHGCVLVLKGHNTLIASPEGNVLVNVTGNSGLAKGGTGDILTGVVASLLCQGAGAMQAAVCGVWLHGMAGDIVAERLTEYGMAPEDVCASLGLAFKSLER